MSGYFRLIILAAILLGGILGVLVIENHTAWAERSDSPMTTLTVNTLDDELNTDGDCSLREAITAANINSPTDACISGSDVITDTITFAVQGTIQLIEQLDVASTGPLVLDGAGTIILDGGTGNYRIFNVNSGADLTLEGLHMNSGSADEGGGIYNSGKLVLSNSILTNNVAWSYDKGGGGIYNTGTLTVISSTLSGNYTFYHIGGGIYNLGLLTITGSVLSGNGAYHNGGGIYNDGVTTIANSTISGNSVNYYGGGIENSGTVFLKNSTLSGNHALYGGGVSNSDVMTITNSTLSGNNATYEGGGISTGGTLVVESSTVSNNTSGDVGGGIYGSGLGLTLRNAILAENSATRDGPDCYAMTLNTEGYNLVGNKAGCDFIPVTGDLINVDAKLRPLQNYGGPTQTHALLSSSPAIDAADPAGCLDYQGSLLTNDQRGYPRFGRCDIGAYEWQPIGPNVVFLPSVFKSCAIRLFFDDFSNPGSGWPVGENQDVRFQYLNNEYRILVKSNYLWAGARPGFSATDYVVVVDARNASSVDASYGIIFGVSADWSQFYSFEIGPGSNYAIFRVNSNLWTYLASGTSDSIHSGTATNQLKIERNGSQIRAYANGDLLELIDDETYVGPRYIGLIAVSHLQSNVDIRFDNFSVYQIGCGPSSTFRIEERGMPAGDDIELDSKKNWENQHIHSITP